MRDVRAGTLFPSPERRRKTCLGGQISELVRREHRTGGVLMLRFAIAAIALALTVSSASAQSRVQTGVLECRAQPSVGMIVGSVRNLECVFKPNVGRAQLYSATQGRL